MAKDDPRLGRLLADKYRLEALLGAGGMGYVYRATNVQVGRAVAIKLLREEYAENAEVVDRFLREARTANLVRHTNVVDVLDLGKDEAGVPFLVQELLDGQNLADVLESRGGSLTPAEIDALFLPVVDAVAEAHARGVVHRDLKPDNVFIAKINGKRVPKLLDFGISKVKNPDVRATDVGVMMGTPAYMPPEQVKGARDADARSDVWALGVMLFEALSGRLPFTQTDAPALFVAIVTEDAPRLAAVAPGVPAVLSRVVERCLRRSPDDRYPSAAELARDLRHALAGTELEPTQRRSLPPSMAAMVPDLELPAAPLLPKRTAPEPPSSNDLIERTALAPASSHRMPAAAASGGTLVQTGGRGSVRTVEAAPPAMGEVALDEPSPRAARSAPASLPGMMLGPGAAPPPPRSSTAAFAGPVRGGVRDRDPSPPPAADGSRRVVAISAVGTASLVGVAVLMAALHRADGWPVAKFLVNASGTPNVLSQGIMALAALLVGGSQAKRAVHQWEGETAGGIPGALLTAAVAAVALFCAVELARAAT